MNQSRTKLLNLFLLSAVILELETPLQAQTARIESISPPTGKVLLKRENRSDFSPVATGTHIYEGDQIFPAQGVRVRVICPDRTDKPVSAGVPSGIKTICLKWEVRIAKAPQPPGVLGGINNAIPYIISPRHSLLLNDTPTLQWNPVSETNQYAVHLLAPQGVVWQTQVTSNQVAYPGPLEPGIPYALTVQTDTGQSSKQEGASNLAFIVLRPSEAQTVKAESTKIVQQKLSPLVTALLLADLYSHYTLPASTLEAYRLTSEVARSYNLTVDAIATLETLTKQGENSPIVYRLLGELYWQSGLANLAIQNYLKVTELAQSPAYLEEKP